jgi:hypothetical protein
MSDPPGTRYLEGYESPLGAAVCKNVGKGQCKCAEGRCWYNEMEVRKRRNLKAITPETWDGTEAHIPTSVGLTPSTKQSPLRIARSGGRLSDQELEAMLDNWVDGKALVVEVLATRQEMAKMKAEMEDLKRSTRMGLLEEIRKLVE